MLLKDSRYQKPVTFANAETHSSVFQGIRHRQIGPATGVIEHQVKEGERLDLLAYHYYNNPRLWWRIVDANPDVLFAGELVLNDVLGQTLLIPKAQE